MAWKSPLSLQCCAARGLAHCLIYSTEDRVRTAISLVPAELLIARATTDLLVRDDDDDEDDGDDNDDAERRVDIDVNVMEYAMLQVKGVVCSMRLWVCSVPGAPRKWLLDAISGTTEIHPHHYLDFPRQLTCLVLRLTLLHDVFLEPDYADQDRRCLVPFAWERWVARLVLKLAPFPQLQKLSIYGGLYPSILAAILRGVPNLTSLHISHINITDDILLIAGRCCPGLTSFPLLHNFPWQVISTSAFYRAFFSGATRREVTLALHGQESGAVQLSFPNLSEVEIAYGDHEVAQEFQRILLALYPTITSPWKTNIFEDGYGSHCGRVMVPLLPYLSLALTTIYLDTPTLATLSPSLAQHLAQSCPQITCITVDCGSQASLKVCEAAGNRLVQLASTWPNLSQVHVNVSDEDHLTRTSLQPLFTSYGASFTSFTMEAAAPGNRLHAATIMHFLELCPNLKSLEVRVWSRSQVRAPLNPQACLGVASCPSLCYLGLHEDGPGDEDDPGVEIGHVARWGVLLTGLLGSSTRLASLSTSLCRGLAPLLDKLTLDISTLHLHVSDPQDWQPTPDQIVGWVSRLPHLQHIYLEEISGQVFWKLRRRYQHTDLQLHWGNMHGWPRTW